MSISTFEEIFAWQKARELTKLIYSLTKLPKFSRDFALRDQICRASVSVMSNIAEGFERHSNAEFVNFLYIAKASSGEVRSQLYVALDQGYITETQLKNAQTLTLDCSRLISLFITSLKKK